jgi:hypothetical protein
MKNRSMGFLLRKLRRITRLGFQTTPLSPDQYLNLLSLLNSYDRQLSNARHRNCPICKATLAGKFTYSSSS